MSIFDKKIRSRILNAVGTYFIGSPKSLRVPGDFYYLPVDRNMPQPGEDSNEQMMGRVYTNRIRIEMTRRGFKVAQILNLLIFVVAAVITVNTTWNTLEKHNVPAFSNLIPAIGQLLPSGSGNVVARPQVASNEIKWSSLPEGAENASATSYYNSEVLRLGKTKVCADIANSLAVYSKASLDVETRGYAASNRFQYERLGCGK